jgi:hypothetical protein
LIRTASDRPTSLIRSAITSASDGSVNRESVALGWSVVTLVLLVAVRCAGGLLGRTLLVLA